MSYLDKKDGLSRTLRQKLAQLPEQFKVMEDQIDPLLQRISALSESIAYYQLTNKPDGTFKDFIQKNVLMVLNSIKNFDYQLEEQKLLNLVDHKYTSAHIQKQQIIECLLGWITRYEMWINACAYSNFTHNELAVYKDLVNQLDVNLKKPVALLFNYIIDNFKEISLPELENHWQYKIETETIRYPIKFFLATGYKILNSIAYLSQNCELYEQEIMNSGNNDPAIGLLIAFIKNYQKIIQIFNQRWKNYPLYYLNQILQAGTPKPLPDSTFIHLIKAKSPEEIRIPKHTVFLTDKQVRFESISETIINNIQLLQMWAIQEECDPEIEPVGKFQYVTALRKTDLTHCINAPVDTPVINVFKEKGEKQIQNENQPENDYTSVGLCIGSTALLLKGGKRTLTISLILGENSVLNFLQMVEQIREKSEMSKQDVLSNLLSDIFYLEITTIKEWKTLDSFSVSFHQLTKKSAFEIKVTLDENFPAIEALSTDSWDTPALRILLNRNAWMYPYSWLKDYEFETVKINTEVSNLTDLQIYSELGKLDISMPFLPFGINPRQGSWMVLGSYEMMLKTIQSFDLSIKWANLPETDTGFAEYFQLYNKGINNCSYKVEVEALKNRHWQPEKIHRSHFLYSTVNSSNAQETAPYGQLNNNSQLSNIQFEKLNADLLNPDDFSYNMFTNNGFFKIRLTDPAFGFGHSNYQKTLSDTMISAIRAKKSIELPNPPFVPQVEYISVNYRSEDEINPGKPDHPLSSKLAYIHAFDSQATDLVPAGNTFKLIPSYNSKGNLLFGLNGVKGGETIRLFLALSPTLREISKEQFPVIHADYGNGYKWTNLPKGNLLSDGTRKLTESGILELIIPHDLPNCENSKDHLFWLRLCIDRYVENVSDIKGFYLHTIQVSRIIDNNNPENRFQLLPPLSIKKTAQKIPGLKAITQLTSSVGGMAPEDFETKRIRIAERISHRNRAVNARDYERLVLTRFPEVRKVKCLPATDSKGHRQGIVSLVIIPQNTGRVRTPKATSKLLLDIEDNIQKLAGPFAIVDAINPEYEYLQVISKIVLYPDRAEGYYLRLLSKEISNYLAYWEPLNEAPVFGHTVSLIDLANFIRSRNYVAKIENFSLLHLRGKGELVYELIQKTEYEPELSTSGNIRNNVKILLNKKEINFRELEPIAASHPWGILVPMEQHLLVATQEKPNSPAGINELEIGNTFVIS